MEMCMDKCMDMRNISKLNNDHDDHDDYHDGDGDDGGGDRLRWR